MSEAERLRRQQYKRNRKKWITVQIIALAVVLVIALACFVVYDRMNRTYYIEYTENGDVDFKVFLNDNQFFEDDYLGKDQSYVAGLIKNIVADFSYDLNMDASGVGFDYTYQIDAQMIIANKDSGDYIFAPVYEIVPKTRETVENGNRLEIDKSVAIDFNKYDALATEFVNAYDLKRTTSTLVVTMTVDVLSRCDEFEDNNQNTYFVALNIPLTEENFSIFTTSSTAEAESKVLACSGAVNQNIFLIIAIVMLSLAVLMAAFLTAFSYLTRNEDVTYTNKVRKLVSSYRAFIQQMEGEFDVTDYQIVPIKTFNEMLGIRDTIQSPILMFENLDQTMTEFVIPTNTKILYTFTIKVDNYDEIYAVPEEEEPIIEEEPVVEEEPVIEEPVVEEPEEEVVIIEENVPEEAIEEALATPDVVLEEINYVEDNDVDYEGTEEEPGMEVVGVVWPERAKKNKVYRYDPNGEKLEKGDIVLVPTRDAAKNREVIRKAAITHGNHKIDPASHPYTLKKIIGVIRRHADTLLAPMPKQEEVQAPVQEKAVPAVTEEQPVITEAVDKAMEETPAVTEAVVAEVTEAAEQAQEIQE